MAVLDCIVWVPFSAIALMKHNRTDGLPGDTMFGNSRPISSDLPISLFPVVCFHQRTFPLYILSRHQQGANALLLSN